MKKQEYRYYITFRFFCSALSRRQCNNTVSRCCILMNLLSLAQPLTVLEAYEIAFYDDEKPYEPCRPNYTQITFNESECEVASAHVGRPWLGRFSADNVTGGCVFYGGLVAFNSHVSENCSKESTRRDPCDLAFYMCKFTGSLLSIPLTPSMSLLPSSRNHATNSTYSIDEAGAVAGLALLVSVSMTVFVTYSTGRRLRVMCRRDGKWSVVPARARAMNGGNLVRVQDTHLL